MINVIQASEIVRKYSPTTKLKITSGCDGLYLTETNEILIGRDWHLGGLLHELTHALLYLEEKRTGHDGVFADRFTKLVGEVLCDYNIGKIKEIEK
jgi:hypothetical protein